MTAQNERNILEDVITLSLQMNSILKAVERLDEANEGTLRTRGMKERLTIAEANIQANKDAWEKVDRHIEEVEKRFNATLQEAFTEVKNSMSGIITENLNQKTILQKWTPYLNVLAWLATAAGGILLMQILTGQVVLIRP